MMASQPPTPARFSPAAALAGLLAIGIGVLYLLEVAGSIEVDEPVLWPLSILALGVAMVAEALLRQARRER